MDMERLVQAAIVKVCGIDVARVDPTAQLADIGVDSLAAAEVLVELEIQLNKQLPVDVLRRLEQVKTVRDIAVQLTRRSRTGRRRWTDNRHGVSPRRRYLARRDCTSLRFLGRVLRALAR